MSVPAPASRRHGPTGWQFTPLACLAREVTARIFGLPLAWVVRGPRVVGAEHLAELEPPVLICPTHASHFDTSTLRLAVGPKLRRQLAAAAASRLLHRDADPLVLRRLARLVRVEAAWDFGGVHRRRRGDAGRRLERPPVPGGDAEHDRRDRGPPPGDRQARLRHRAAGAAGPDRGHRRRPAQGLVAAAPVPGGGALRNAAAGRAGEDPRAFTAGLERVVRAV